MWENPPMNKKEHFQNPSISEQACCAQYLRWKAEDAETFQTKSSTAGGELVKYLLQTYVASDERRVKDDTCPW